MEKLLFDLVKVTEKAAIESYKWVGKGDEKSADKDAVEAMRSALNNMDIEGTIVIGEGERDQAPMLYIGEKLGKGGMKFDIAVDPLEGTTICANGSEGAISVIVFGESDSLLHAPDVYMNKIAIGVGYPDNLIDIDNDIEKNLDNLAKFKNIDLSDLNVTVLKRERHNELISRIRKKGARIKLINDGDISAVIEVALGKSDMYVGIGGAPEGVIAAAALKILGGQMETKLIFDNEASIIRAKKMEIKNIDRKYNIQDLVKSNIIFCATGVTDGSLLKGVKKTDNHIITNSLLIDSFSNSVRNITVRHIYHC